MSLNQYPATIPYLDRAPGRLTCGQEDYHPEDEALREMGSDIRREKGAEDPLNVLFQIKISTDSFPSFNGSVWVTCEK